MLLTLPGSDQKNLNRHPAEQWPVLRVHISVLKGGKADNCFGLKEFASEDGGRGLEPRNAGGF